MIQLPASYEILTPISEGGLKELKLIESIGRTCYKSEDLITEDGESAKKFVKMLINNNHDAMLEHSFLSVMFTVDRGVTHEMVRHRMASFAQESTRWCDYSKGKFDSQITFINIEGGITVEGKNYDKLSEILNEWYQACVDAERHYKKLKELGASTDIARSVLLNSTKANITISTNYREWRHIFRLRSEGVTGPPHPQMREVMDPLLEELKHSLPIIFDDLK